MLGGIANHKNFGALFQVFHFSTAAVVDTVAQTSTAFDLAPPGGQSTESISVLFGFTPSVFAGADTAIMSLVVEDSADNSSWATAASSVQPAAAITVVVGAPVGVGLVTVKRYDFKASSCRRYVRIKGAIDLTGTAAGSMQLVGIAGGGVAQPQYAPAYGSTDFQPNYSL